MKEKIQNLIVGAGISGSVMARLLAEAGQSCVVIDQRKYVGGNCYDYKTPCGIIIHKYGPHIFHTNDKEVWNFLSRFTSWTPYMHKVKGYVDGQEVPIPFNLNSLYMLFPPQYAARMESKLIENFGFNKKVPILTLRKTEDKDLAFLAEYIYEKVFFHYTLKQWGLNPQELDPSVMERVPVFISRDDRYFQDKYQAVAANGYTALFEKMLAHPNIKVRLNAPFASVRKDYEYQRLFYSGPIDEYFDFSFGALPYRSLRFDLRKMDLPQYQSAAVINYPTNYDYTRVTEYKHFLPQAGSKTIVAFEYPSDFQLGENERYYPVPGEQSASLYKKYLQEAQKENNVFFFGRLGGYKYYDMHVAAKDAFALVQKILAGQS